MASWEEASEDYIKILEDDEGEDINADYDVKEYLVKAVDSSEDEAEKYVAWNEPEPAEVSRWPTSSVFDGFRPLHIPSRSSSPPRASSSPAAGSCSPSIIESSDFIYPFPFVDDDSITLKEQPQQQCLPCLDATGHGGAAGRGAAESSATRRGAAQRGAAQRGRGWGRDPWKAPIGDPQWVRGERLIEVHVDNDDMSEELREEILNIVNAREVARGRLLSRERKAREENEGEAGDDEFQSIFDAAGTSNLFDWSPMGDFELKREQFLPQQTGAVVTPRNAYEAFRQYWDDGIMTHIANETNRYAAGLARSSAAFAQSWYDTDIHELFILFSFWMMLGIIRMPSIKSCFTTNPILQTNIFRQMFTRLRYENLCRAFHLADNSKKPTDKTDPLFALGPIIDHLNSRFRESYIPSRNVCIHESLTLWKGDLSFRQYIQTKAAQYGVKTYELCESSTGYLWSFFVYLGAGTSNDTGLPSTEQESTTIVLQLIRPLLDKGYTLFLNKLLNSPVLARFLKTRKTDCVGILRENCTNVPELISLCKLKEGQFVARHSGDVVVLALQDNKCKIATISTYHGNEQGQMSAKPHRPALYQPQVVLDYNMCMGGVARKDQMLEPYLLVRKKAAKLNVKFFKQLLSCSIFNARVLLQSSTGSPKCHIAFSLELVDHIMRLHHKHVPQRQTNRPTGTELACHFPRKTDQHTKDGRFKQRRCTYCSNQHSRRRNTAYVCSSCEVPLCVDSCFEAYHKYKKLC